MAEVNLGNDTELNVSLGSQTNLSANVYDINYIPDYVKAEQERRANETIRIANENERQENEEDRIALYEDLENKRDTDYWRGSTGATPSINATASISGGTGTPGVIVTKTGTDEEPNLSFAFTNLKGDKGDKGDPGAIKFLIVQSLPSTGAGDTIYLVPITPDTSENNYEEYIYVNGSWELLGRIGVHVDLTGYETISDARNDYAHTLTMSYNNQTHTLNIGIANYNGQVLDSGGIEDIANLSYVDGKIGDIDSVLDAINNEVI